MTETKPMSFRAILYYSAFSGCWVHMLGALFLPKNLFTIGLLVVGALALSGMFYVLGKTKRTLVPEQHLPESFYTTCTWGWAVAGVVWGFLGSI